MSLRGGLATKTGTTPTGRPKRSYRKRADKERFTVQEFESTVYVEVAQELQMNRDPNLTRIAEYIKHQQHKHTHSPIPATTATPEEEKTFLDSTWKALLACWQPGGTRGIDVYMKFVASKLFKHKNVVGILFSAEETSYSATMPSLLDREDICFRYDLNNGEPVKQEEPQLPEDDMMIHIPVEQHAKRGRKGIKRKDYYTDSLEKVPYVPVCTERGLPICIKVQDDTKQTPHELLTASVSYLDHAVCSLRFRQQTQYETLDENFSYACERDIDDTAALFVVFHTSDMHPVAVEFYALEKDLKMVIHNITMHAMHDVSFLTNTDEKEKKV